MAKVHIVQGNGGLYTAILHSSVPIGNNSVGISWKTCLLNSMSVPPKTIMSIGTGAGQITQAEADQITAGDIVEYQSGIQVNADGSTPSSSIINTRVDQEISIQNSSFAVRFKYFGYTQG